MGHPARKWDHDEDHHEGADSQAGGHSGFHLKEHHRHSPGRRGGTGQIPGPVGRLVKSPKTWAGLGILGAVAYLWKRFSKKK